jgi:hypothetical protein
LIIDVGALPVFTVYLLADVPKVLNSVVGFVAVNVVDISIGPTSMYISPDEAAVNVGFPQ